MNRWRRCRSCWSQPCTCGATPIIAITALARHAKRLRAERDAARAALLELALAAEAFDWGDAPQPRMRAAVTAALALADPAGVAQRAARRAAGCSICGAAYTEADPPEAEFCARCAMGIPCVVCGEKGECPCFT